jgi:hypothetical protein
MPTFGVLTALQRVSGGPEAECRKTAGRWQAFSPGVEAPGWLQWVSWSRRGLEAPAVRRFASLLQDQLARLVAALPPRALKEAVIDEAARSLWPAWRRWSPAR